jgi:TolA-binding protein
MLLPPPPPSTPRDNALLELADAFTDIHALQATLADSALYVRQLRRRITDLELTVQHQQQQSQQQRQQQQRVEAADRQRDQDEGGPSSWLAAAALHADSPAAAADAT